DPLGWFSPDSLRRVDLFGKSVVAHARFAGDAFGLLAKAKEAIQRLQAEGGTGAFGHSKGSAEAGQVASKLPPLFFAGHSKGSAEAELLSLFLAQDGIMLSQGYGFGAARPGKSKLADVAVESGVAERWFQLEQPNDPIPMWPFH